MGGGDGRQSTDQRPTHVRYLVLALACSLSFLLYLHRYSWGFIKKDLQDEFGWDPVLLGTLDGLFAAFYAVGQVPSGMLADWFGARIVLGIGVFLWTAALAGFAYIANVPGMAAMRVAFGLAQAGCYPVLNKVSKNWFPMSLRTTAQGLIATFFGRGGGAAAFFLFGTVLVGWLGLPWREALLAFVVAGLVTGSAFVLLFRNTPREHPLANEAEAQLITVNDPQAAFATRARIRWGALFGSVTVWFLFFRALTSNMADVLFVYWMPLYLREGVGLSALSAGWLSALPLIGGAMGGAFSGSLQSWLLSRASNRRWVRSGVAGMGKGIAGGLMLGALLLPGGVAVAWTFLAVRFFCDWEQAAEWGTVSDVAGRNSATVFACVNTAGALGGAIASPLTGMVLLYFSSGSQQSAAGWNAVFVLIAVEYFLSAAAWLFIDCRKPIEPM
jgi:sugar phosphate permease